MVPKTLSRARERLFRTPHDSLSGPLSWPIRLTRLFWLATEDFLLNDGFQRASALAFATLLSLLPLSVLFFSIAGSLGGGDRIIEFVKTDIFPKLAPSFQNDLSQWMDEFISKDAFQRTELGILNVAAILSLFLAAMGMMVAAERNLNRIFRAPRNRSYLAKMRAFWLILSLSPLFIAGSMKVTGLLSPEGGTLEHLLAEHWWIRTLYEILVPATIGLVGFTIIFAVLPNCRVRLRSAIVGGFVTALAWEGSKAIFFVYLEGAQDVTSFYPKVAALPLFLLWLLLNWIITLYGAEVAYVHQDFLRLSALKGAATGGAIPVMRCALVMLGLAKERFQHGEGLVAEAIAQDTGESTASVLAAGRLLAQQGVLVEDAALSGRFVLAGDLRSQRLEDVMAYLLERLPTQAAFSEPRPAISAPVIE